MRISYSTTTNRVIPKAESILAAKVLFKLLGPGDSSTDLKTYVQNCDFAGPTKTWCSVAYLLNILDLLKPSICHIRWRSVDALLSF